MPFESYVKAFGQGNVEIQLQIIMNVLMFVLLGAMLPLCFKHFEKNKEVVLTAFNDFDFDRNDSRCDAHRDVRGG